MGSKANLLLVDDVEANLAALSEVLRSDDVELVLARSGPEALEHLLVHDVALAIIDVQMPEMDGFELAELMRGVARTRQVPIVFVTAGAHDVQRRFRGYEAGAVDFLYKPIEPEILRGKVNVFVRLYLDRKEIARQRDELRELLEEKSRLLQERQLAEKKLRESEEQVRLLNADLQKRVSERTAELVTTTAQMEELQEQFIQAQKMESIGTLAGGIAHDFNNILHIIQGHAYLLRDETDQKEISETLTVIEDTVQRGASLVQELLTLARKTEPKLDSVDTAAIIEDLIALIRQTFPKTIQLAARVAPDVPLVIADKNQIVQALLNLCVNARDAMPEGGQLTFTTYMVDRGKLERSAEAAAERYVCIEISDTGMGMDEDLRKRIFEPFFTTKEIGRGTGLGLSVVYGIIKNHAGFIDVESKPMCGTTFRLYLPVSVAAEESPRARVAERAREGSIPRGRGTILLVEDERDTLSLLQRVLLQHGYRVIPANDGQIAVEIYEREKENIAAVLLDMGLPKVAGKDVLSKIKQLNPKIKVAVVSGYIEPELQSCIDQLGVRNFIRKPCSPEEVLRTLNNMTAFETQ